MNDRSRELARRQARVMKIIERHSRHFSYGGEQYTIQEVSSDEKRTTLPGIPGR